MGIYDGYQDGESKSIKQLMDHWYQESYTANSSFWSEGQIDTRFKVGDQELLSTLYGDGAFYSKRKFYFNLIRRHINMIVGYQRQHRKSASLVPTSDRHNQMSSHVTKLNLYSERQENYHEYMSQAFDGGVTTGQNMLHLRPDYTYDPVSGDFRTDALGFNDYMIDPYWRKDDLSDCNFIWRREWVSKDVAKRYLPGREKDIDKMKPDGMGDNRFPTQAEAILGDTKKLFTYDQFYHLDTREATIIVDRKNGETMEWEDLPDDAPDELERTLQAQPWLATTKVQKPTVKLAIVLGGKVMYEGENLLKTDRYPFVPVTCYREPNINAYSWRTMGVVRNLRDAQYLYNRRKIIELDILESQINSGYKYKVGAVQDEAVFRQTGQGFLIPVQTEMADVERLEAPGIPSSMMELSRSLSEDLTKISGVSEELLGAAEDDKAGVLSMLRQAANLTTLQTIFDKLDGAHKQFISLRTEAIRKNWSKGKIESILGEEMDPRMRLTSSQKYDVAIEMGSYSTTQKQMEFKQLVYLRELGVPISDEDLIQAATIQNKDKILENMQAAAQKQEQVQQQQMEMQQQELNQKQMLGFAKAQNDMASAQEKKASSAQKIIQMSEIEARAERDETESDLNLVRQMIELENLDLEQVRKSLEMAEYIRAQTESREASYEIS